MSRLNGSRRRAFVIVMVVFLMTALACGSLTFGSSPNAPGESQAPTATKESSAPPTWPPTWTPTSSPPPATDSPTPAPAITLTPAATSTSVSIPTVQATAGAENPFADLPLEMSQECDFEGLAEASRECRPTEIVCSGTMNWWGIILSAVTRYEIRGMEAGKCVLSQRTEDYDLRFDDVLVEKMLAEGATQEEIDRGEQEARDLARAQTIGLEQICKFDTSDLVFLFDQMNEGVFSSSDWEAGDCEWIHPAGQ